MNLANLSTKRQWIAELARTKPGKVLFSLHHVIDLEWMRKAYWLTRKEERLASMVSRRRNMKRT